MPHNNKILIYAYKKGKIEAPKIIMIIIICALVRSCVDDEPQPKIKTNMDFRSQSMKL